MHASTGLEMCNSWRRIEIELFTITWQQCHVQIFGLSQRYGYEYIFVGSSGMSLVDDLLGRNGIKSEQHLLLQTECRLAGGSVRQEASVLGGSDLWSCCHYCR
jgi:hypothetical protein